MSNVKTIIQNSPDVSPRRESGSRPKRREKLNNFNKPAGRFNNPPPAEIQQLQQGFALLSVLIVGAMLVAVVTVSVAVVIINGKIDLTQRAGIALEDAARSGLDNALLRLARDTGYTGESLTLNSVNLIIEVVEGDNPYVVRVKGTAADGGHILTLERQVTFDDDGVMMVGKEVRP